MSKRKSTFTGPRAAWYLCWRLHRIIIRESFKANIDAMIYGTGFVMITSEPDYVQHIPAQQVIIKGALQ